MGKAAANGEAEAERTSTYTRRAIFVEISSFTGQERHISAEDSATADRVGSAGWGDGETYR